MKTLFLILLFISPSIFAADVNVSWVYPTTYTTGAPMPIEEAKEIAIQYGTCTTATVPTFGTLTKEVIVPAPATTTKLTGVVAGTYCWRLKLTDTLLRVSAWTTVISKVIVETKPKAPINVVVIQ